MSVTDTKFIRTNKQPHPERRNFCPSFRKISEIASQVAAKRLVPGISHPTARTGNSRIQEEEDEGDKRKEDIERKEEV